jgi:hypothetical protein
MLLAAALVAHIAQAMPLSLPLTWDLYFQSFLIPFTIYPSSLAKWPLSLVASTSFMANYEFQKLVTHH